MAKENKKHQMLRENEKPKICLKKVETALCTTDNGTSDIDLQRSHLAALNLMEDAQISRQRAESLNIELQKEIEEHKQAEEQIKSIAKFPAENPQPVLRVNADGTIMYSNIPGQELLSEWNCQVGQKVPDNWLNFIENSLRYNHQMTEQVKCGQSILSIVITPIPEAGYVNLYGRDITVQEQIKDELRKSRDELDVKVHQRTTELAQTVAILQKEIKERIVAQTELKERTKVLDAFFAHTITPLVILDKDFSFIRVNEAYADSCQMNINDFAGKNHFELFPNMENESIFKNVIRTKQSHQAVAKPFEFSTHPEWGVTYWDWTLVPILDEDSNVEFLVFSLMNVTGRKQAEIALSQSEKNYRSLVEFSPESVCVLVDEKIVFANPASLKLIKAKNFGEVSGKSIWNFIHADSIESTRKDMKTLLERKRRVPPKEIKIILLDGSLMELETTATPVVHQGKEAILILFHDITERKSAERRKTVLNYLLDLFVGTTSKKEYMDSVVEIIGDWSGCKCTGIRLKDEDGFIPYESYTGFSEEFISMENGRSLKNTDCICVRIIAQNTEHGDKSMLTSKGSFRCNNFPEFIKSPPKDHNRYNCGEFRFVSLAVIPIKYMEKILGVIHLADEQVNKVPSDKIEFIENMAAMVGEALHRFDVENTLRLNEKRLVEAQRLAHLGNWEWDITRNRLWWSDEVYRIFGFEPKLFGVTYDDFMTYVHPDDRKMVQETINQALLGNKEYDIDYRIFRLDKIERIVNVKAEVAFDAKGKPVKMAGMIYDITEQKKAEDEIRRNQKELRALSAELQLAEEQERRRIAQDLHDSVGQILAFSGRELKHLRKNLSGTAAKTIEEISNQIDLAVTQTRTLSFDLSPSILYDLGFEVAIEDLVDRISKERNVLCSYKNCPQPKPLKDEVKVLLYRSVRELLFNAVKYAQAEHVKVSLLRSNSDIYIKVEDDGTGFDVSILDNSATKRKGFGIFSIRERLNHIGGKLKIESAKGQGTKAVLIAPLDVEQEMK